MVKYITEEEYDRLLNEYVTGLEVPPDEEEKTWDWFARMQKEFDKTLAEQGIAKQK